jgi:hypothetical protein
MSQVRRNNICILLFFLSFFLRFQQLSRHGSYRERTSRNIRTWSTKGLFIHLSQLFAYSIYWRPCIRYLLFRIYFCLRSKMGQWTSNSGWSIWNPAKRWTTRCTITVSVLAHLENGANINVIMFVIISRRNRASIWKIPQFTGWQDTAARLGQISRRFGCERWASLFLEKENFH